MEQQYIKVKEEVKMNENTRENLMIISCLFFATILATSIVIYANKKENYNILNIENNKIIYQINNRLYTENIDNIIITIDNSINKPILIKNNLFYKELLINEKDYNEYLKVIKDK